MSAHRVPRRLRPDPGYVIPVGQGVVKISRVYLVQGYAEEGQPGDQAYGDQGQNGAVVHDVPDDKTRKSWQCSRRTYLSGCSPGRKPTTT